MFSPGDAPKTKQINVDISSESMTGMDLKTFQIWFQLPLLIGAYPPSAKPEQRHSRTLRSILRFGLAADIALCTWTILKTAFLDSHCTTCM